MRYNITTNEWADCLARLRGARALILGDAESFHEAATSLEHIGQILCGKIRTGLGKYEPELLELAMVTGQHEPAETARLFKVVREARNMAVHEGAWARHLSSRLIDLFLILEEAIILKMDHVEDIMVRTPVVAEPWWMVAHVRREMLASSFSNLPICLDGQWRLVRDVDVMRYLRDARDSSDQKERMSMTIGEAIRKRKIGADPAVCCRPKDTIQQLLVEMKEQDHPVLVTQNIGDEPRLLGIVTPFDLL